MSPSWIPARCMQSQTEKHIEMAKPKTEQWFPGNTPQEKQLSQTWHKEIWVWRNYSVPSCRGGYVDLQMCQYP